MKHGLFIVLLALALTPVMLFAQPEPGGGGIGPFAQPNQPNQPLRPPQVQPIRNAVVEVTPAGLFIIANGVLARYSADLEQVATVTLIPPAPQMIDGQEPQFMIRMQREQVLRNVPCSVLAAGDALYVANGATLFRVNQQTLKVEKLPLEQAAARNDIFSYQAPAMKLQENILYLVRGTEVVTVDVKGLTVLGRADLPKDMLPQPMIIREVQPPQPPNPGPPPNPGNPPMVGVGPFAQPDPGAPAPAAAGQQTTIVGVLTRKDGADQWTLKDDEGGLYLLSGDVAQKIGVDANGKRARVSGLLDTRRPVGEAKGTLQAREVQVLGG